ncbi:MAG TPA: IS66 family insertion sequence element accessory protein TnpB [Hyphomicrobium zavarzinii]|nr:IS66 family insertion sequence element accessory protein TnpB [Hyphomicrobium zavarzinii]
MTISELTLKSSVEIDEPVRRLEVFTGAGRRRDWSAEDKARIVAESFEAGATVSAIARRQALSPQQLFTGRREIRKAAEAVPAVIAPEPASTSEQTAQSLRPRRRARSRRAAAIEIDIAGVRVTIENGASPVTIAAARRVEGRIVIGPTGAVRVMVATNPVNFRKGAEGLAALVRETMGADLFSGNVDVFRAKRPDRVKLVFWDGTRVVLVSKRLED